MFRWFLRSSVRSGPYANHVRKQRICRRARVVIDRAAVSCFAISTLPPARRNVNFTATLITRSRVVGRFDESAGVKARSEASARSRYRIESERSVIRRIESYLWPRAASSVDAWVDLQTGNSGRTRVFDVLGARAEVGEEMDRKERAEKGAGVESRGSRGATRKWKKKRKTVCLVAWPADGTS